MSCLKFYHIHIYIDLVRIILYWKDPCHERRPRRCRVRRHLGFSAGIELERGGASDDALRRANHLGERRDRNSLIPRQVYQRARKLLRVVRCLRRLRGVAEEQESRLSSPNFLELLMQLRLACEMMRLVHDNESIPLGAC